MGSVVLSSALSTMLGHLVIVTGAFVLLFVLIRLFAWQKITAIFDKRANYITNEIEEAERARRLAEDLVAQRQAELAGVDQKAEELLLEAKASAEALKARLLADAEVQVAEIKAKAEKDIQRQKAEAIASMKDEVSSISLELAQQILMKELDAAGHAQLIDRYLEQLGD